GDGDSCVEGSRVVRQIIDTAERGPQARAAQARETKGECAQGALRRRPTALSIKGISNRRRAQRRAHTTANTRPCAYRPKAAHAVAPSRSPLRSNPPKPRHPGVSTTPTSPPIHWRGNSCIRGELLHRGKDPLRTCPQARG